MGTSAGISDVGAGRVAWADYAKGFCIIMVVMMHSTLGVGFAAGREGWLHAVVEFVRPFRMPDFFLISGLFLARVIDRDWRTYLDRKVVHFAYFYVLWTTIQLILKAPALAAEYGWEGVLRFYLLSFIEPFGTLWFIYLLPIFFVLAKLTKRVPPVLIWLLGAALEVAPIHTGWTVVDEFAGRFVYVYTGYILAPHIFRFAAGVGARPALAVIALIAWSALNGVLVFGGYGDLPLLSLALGLIGCAAVVALSVLWSRQDAFPPLRYCGQHSIVIYLAFFLPMAVSRALLLKSGIVSDIGTISLLVTAAGVIGALLIYWAARATRYRFLFERPDRFWIAPKPRTALQPAE
jgi:uncharacterized membrane protein YcfT